MEFNQINGDGDTQTPIPSTNAVASYDVQPVSVLLDHADASPTDHNTIEIALKIINNINKSFKTASFSYNPCTDTPYKLTMQTIADHKLSTNLKTKIETIITQCATLNEYNTENTTVHNRDVLSQSMIEDEKQFIDALDQSDITIEDILNIYSFEKQRLFTVGSILCNNCLYLINATKLKRWKHFQRITNIEHILKDKTESIIDDEIALEILKNMRIECESAESEIMKPHLVGSNIKQLRQNILLSDDKLLFEMNDCIRRVRIEEVYNEERISKEKRDEILESVLNAFDVREQKQIQNDLWITLERFITQQQWNQMKRALDSLSVTIQPIDDDMYTNNESISGVIAVDLTRLSNIKVYKYGFSMSVKDDTNDILCCISGRNQRLQWITYFDAALYSLLNTENEDEKEEEPNNDRVRLYDKYIHDFKQRNHRNADLKRNEYVNSFAFGEILNYWTPHEINSVVPKYKTLKDELLFNDICSSNKEYYAFYEKSQKQICQKRCYVQCTNPDKYGMELDDEWTINHGISTQIFADIGFDSRIKRALIHNTNDALKDITKRNRELAHFCRYLKESCLCFGRVMSRKAVYIGINSFLLFNSMYINMECPFTATMDSKMTQKLAENNKNGVVLALKPVFNGRHPRCFVMNPVNRECMIYGECMAISNIFINGLSNKLYIAAIQLFENVCNGFFIMSYNETTEQTLYTIIMDYLSTQNNLKIPKYIRKIFINVLESKANIWINKQVISEMKNDKLRAILSVDDIFKYKTNVQYVQQFQWNINSLKVMQKSNDFLYDLVDADGIHILITFYFIVTGNRLRFIIKNISSNIKGVKIQIDVLCKEHKFQILSPPKWITAYDEFTLNDSQYDSMNLVFGVKIMDTAKTSTKLHIKQQNVNQSDVDLDVLTLQIAQQIQAQIRGKYQNEINGLNETINVLLRGQSIGDLPQNLKLASKSKSYSQISMTETGRRTLKRKKTFSLMDSGT